MVVDELSGPTTTRRSWRD